MIHHSCGTDMHERTLHNSHMQSAKKDSSNCLHTYIPAPCRHRAINHCPYPGIAVKSRAG